MLSFTAKQEADNRLGKRKSESFAIQSLSQPDGALWCEKHYPKSSEECAMQPKKREEILDWIQRALMAHEEYANRGNMMGGFAPFVLALCGISGCSKSTAVELLCKENNIELIVWSDDLWESTWSCKFNSLSNEYVKSEVPVDFTSYTREKSLVRELFDSNSKGRDDELRAFALQSSFPSLSLTSTSNSSQYSGSNNEKKLKSYNKLPPANMKRIILIHDPPVSNKKAGETPLLANLLASVSDPVILIMTTLTEGRDDDHFATDSILPPSERANVYLESIHCNPIIKARCVTVMDKILRNEGIVPPINESLKTQKPLSVSYKSFLEGIAVSSLGDIRHAINKLQLLLISKEKGSAYIRQHIGDTRKGRNETTSRVAGGGRIKSIVVSDGEDNDNEVDDSRDITSREKSYSSLHSIGKLCHSALNATGGLTFVPEKVLEGCEMNNEIIVEFLQHNVIESIQSTYEAATFGQPNELRYAIKDDMVQLDDTLRNFSDLDLLLGHKYNTSSNIDRMNVASYPDDYVTSLSARICAVSRGPTCTRELIESSAERGYKRSMQCMRRPKIMNLRADIARARGCVNRLRHSMILDMGSACPINCVVLHTLPYLILMNPYCRFYGTPTANLIHACQSPNGRFFTKLSTSQNYMILSEKPSVLVNNNHDQENEVLLLDDIASDD